MDLITLALAKKYTDTVALGQGAVQIPGPQGEGVPNGGTNGQVLHKKSNTNFDTEWKTPDKPSYTASEVNAIPTSEKGTINGVATLGSDGKVPSSQLPPASQSGIEEAPTDGKIYGRKDKDWAEIQAAPSSPSGISQQDIDDSIEEHNTDSTSHDAIRTSISNEVTARTNAINELEEALDEHINEEMPIATQNTVGGVMPGNGMTVDEHGRMDWSGQIPQISYWISSQDLLDGQIGSSTSVLLSSITKISGNNQEPQQSDICYSNDGYCFIIQNVNTEMNMINGSIVQIPPPSAVWNNIQGALHNNQIIPALLANGNSSISLIYLDVSDTVQVGDSSHDVNVRSKGRMTNNLREIALTDELESTRADLQGKIDNEETDRISAISSVSSAILSEGTARSQADLVLQQNLDAEIQTRTNDDAALSTRIDAIIDDSAVDSYSSTLSAHEIISQIDKTFQPIPDVATPQKLPVESSLSAPSICYVDSTQTTWINSKTGKGWKDTGANFATTSDIQNYLIDNGYIKKSHVIDNLLSTDSEAPLSAKQGKILNELKIGVNQIINNLLTDDDAKPLSAAMGKWLNDNAFKITDIIDNLTSTLANKALAANQGRVLNNKITTLEGLFTGGKANNAIQADSALSADKLSAQRRIALNMTGFARGQGYVDTDLSGNAQLNINTEGNLPSAVYAKVNTLIYFNSDLAGNPSYFKFFTIDSSNNTQSTLHMKFHFAWHGMVEVFIPWFNYNTNIFDNGSKWGARRMPGDYMYTTLQYNLKIRWFRNTNNKIEFWLGVTQRNARCLVELEFVTNGVISESSIIFDLDVGKNAGRKLTWPGASDGYTTGCSEIDTSLATSQNGYMYEGAITYMTL